MNLILWRHADAEDMPERASDLQAGDMSRPLTQRGRKQAKAMAEWVLARVDPQAQIRVSPAVRAVETAQALSDQFQIVRELSPGADVAAVLAAVGWPDGLGGAGDTVIVVAHQPTLGRVASLLLSGTEADWAVRKGGIWWLSNRRREGEAQVVLRAVVNPDLVA
jgi:phosphohistidine phosphatase